MPNQVQTILRKVTRPRCTCQPLNILTFPTHERYQSNLGNTGHNFYLWQGQGIKDWKNTYARLPPRHILLNPELGTSQIPEWVDLDLVLSQNKFGQFQIANQIAKQLGLPLVTIEHTLPVPNWTKLQLRQCHEMKGDINLFISKQSRAAWGWSEDEAEVLEHGVDTELFKPIQVQKQPPYALSVVNDWVNRDYCCGFSLWRAVTGFPENSVIPVKVLGDTPGLSRPAESVEQLVQEYNQCTVFLNTSTYSPIPSVLLEAMACGKPVVTTDNYVMSEIIINGVNGYKSNNPEELRTYCIELLKDEDKAKELGRKARETVLSHFSLANFTDKWNNVFYRSLEC